MRGEKTQSSILLGLSDAIWLFPFSLAVSVCTGFGVMGGLVTAVICILLGVGTGVAFRPVWWSFLPIFMLAYRFGTYAASGAIIAAGVFTFLLARIPQDKRQRLLQGPVYAGFLLSAAFSVTALQTTKYFGIGAVGGTVPEIIRDYISLGFHPNWRGILYGTIVMVVLITFPRKFKQLSKKLPAAFVALAITDVLHYFLVPTAEGSPIDEVGAYSFRSVLDGAVWNARLPGSVWPAMICAGLSLALLMSRETERKTMQKLSAVTLTQGLLGGVPVTTDGTKRSVLSAGVCAVFTFALYLFPGLNRTPIHSLAVILIVTAWQGVCWSEVAAAFKGGAKSILLFVCAVALTVFMGVHYAVPLLCLLSVLFISQPKKERS